MSYYRTDLDTDCDEGHRDSNLSSICEETVATSVDISPAHPAYRARQPPRRIRGTNLYRRLEEPDLPEGPAKLRVYLRIKPGQPPQPQPPQPKGKVSGLYEISEDNSVTTVETKNGCEYRKTYNFTRVFDPRTEQAEVFDEVVRDDLVRFVDRDEDFSLLTYGTSGSGKTYSLMGTDAQPGVIPRCLETLFSKIRVSKHPCMRPGNGTLGNLSSAEVASEINIIQNIVKNCPNIKISGKQNSVEAMPSLESYRRMSINLMGKIPALNKQSKNNEYEVWVSFAEIYNERVYDLLRPDVGPNQIPKSLKVVVPSKEQSYIKDIRWVCVRSGAEAFAVLAFGKKRLRFAHTHVNSHSSRSHCFFTLKLVRKVSDDHVAINTFRLCDLAGSERAKKTGNEGARLRESRRINTSLHILEKCLTAIRNVQSGSQVLPPYRESKLTQLLKNALSGQESISMLVNINPEPKMFDETHHVLNFSALASQISVVVEPKRYTSEISQFRVSDLKNSTTYDEFKGQDDLEVYEENRYLRGQIERLEIKLQEREREVRQEIWQDFMEIKEQSEKNAQTHLEKEIELLVKKNDFEMNNMKDYYSYKLNEKNLQIERLESQLRQENTINILNKSNSLDSSQCLNKSSVDQDSHEECKIQIEDLNEIINSYKKQINDLTTELQSTKYKLDMRTSMAFITDNALNEKLTTTETQIKDLEKRIQEIQDEKLKMDDLIITLMKSELDLKTKLEELAAKNYVLEENNNTQMESLEVAYSKIDNLKHEIKKLKTDKKNISLIVEDKSLLPDDNDNSESDEESHENFSSDEKSSPKNTKNWCVRLEKNDLEEMLSNMQINNKSSDSKVKVNDKTSSPKKCFVRLEKCDTLSITLSNIQINKMYSNSKVEVNDDSFGVTPLEVDSINNCNEKKIDSPKKVTVASENVKNKQEEPKKLNEKENRKFISSDILQKSIDDNNPSINNDDVQNMKLPLITPLKTMDDNKNNGFSTSCRKLFSKRILDENAADPKASSAKTLFADVDELKKSGVTPPSLANPYAIEKKTRTARKKKK